MTEPVDHPPSPHPLNHRAASILRAVAAGRAEITVSCRPALRIDGRSCCDQLLAPELVHAGLVCAASFGHTGSWVPAVVTARAVAELAQLGR